MARKPAKPRTPRLFGASWLVFAGGIVAFAGGFLPPASQSLAARTQTQPPQTTAGAPQSTQSGQHPDGRGRGDGPRGDGQRSGGPGRGGEWFWRDEALKKQIGLSDSQAGKIEAYYQKTSKDTSNVWDEFIARNTELDAAVRERKLTRDDLDLKVVMAESLRSKLAESRTMMLYRIDLMLTADQFKKLQDLRDARPRPVRHDWQWWKDDAKRIGLSDQTAAEIDRIYQQRQKGLGPLLAELERAQTDVDSIRHTRGATPEQLDAKVVSLETLRSRLNESRTVMLYLFYQKLTPDQYTKLQQLHDDHGSGRRGGGGGPRR
jgi:Spy/CpxP family protein refolding chaperone